MAVFRTTPVIPCMGLSRQTEHTERIEMTRATELRRSHEANIACGDISEAEEARMLTEIAAAEREEVRAFFVQTDKQYAA